MAEYFIVISVITAIITVYDKLAAKLFPRNRIPEKVLFITGLIGGAAAEYITMKILVLRFDDGLPTDRNPNRTF